MSQKATVKEDSTSVQVGGNLTVGLSFENCERIFNLLLLENMPKLEAIAQEKAVENVHELVRLTYQKLDDRVEKIELKKISEPDVQSTFNTAVQGVAKKGEKIDIDLLANLLQSRLESENDDYIDNCIELAVEIIPKLTNELLSVIPIIHFIQSMSISDQNQLNQALISLDKLYLSKCSEISFNKLKTIASTGAGELITINDSYAVAKLKNRYSMVYANVDGKFQGAIKVLITYEKLKLYKLTLTTSGEVIAIKMLEKIFGEISLKNFLIN